MSASVPGMGPGERLAVAFVAQLMTEGFVPTYEYLCTAEGHRLEVVQKFTDDPLTVCPECGGQLRKVISAVGIVFKGSGFYRNDSRSAAANGKGTGSGDAGKDAGSKDGAGKDGASTDSGSKDSGTKESASAGSGAKDGGSTNGGPSNGGPKNGGGSGSAGGASGSSSAGSPTAAPAAPAKAAASGSSSS